MYSIFAVAHCPKEMLEKFPTPATFENSSIYLFGQTFQRITGTPYESIIDLKTLGFNHPYEEGESGLTSEQLDAYVDELISISGPGEVQLSPSQGLYLYESRFNQPIEDDI